MKVKIHSWGHFVEGDMDHEQFNALESAMKSDWIPAAGPNARNATHEVHFTDGRRMKILLPKVAAVEVTDK